MEKDITYFEILTSLTKTIDLINFLLKDHHRRVAVLSYAIGKAHGLSEDSLANLVMAASLHDIGALTVAERDDLIHIDITNPYPHALLGAAMIKGLPYFIQVTAIIRHHHCKWDENTLENPFPIESLILHLADRIDILYHSKNHALSQIDSIVATLSALSGSLFCPDVFMTFMACSKKESFWLDLEHQALPVILTLALQHKDPIPLNLQVLEGLALTFSKIIDYRNHFTATHSQGVAIIAYTIAKYLGYSEENAMQLKIAGYLHDIGKVAINIEILEKKTPLTEQEFDDIKAHSYFTHIILRELPTLQDITKWASEHHEKRDGSGYPNKLKGNDLSLESDILAFADLFTALSEERPYRKGFIKEDLLKVLREEMLASENQQIYNYIEESFETLNGIRAIVQETAYSAYREAVQEMHNAELN